jgi:hypothetical protein
MDQSDDEPPAGKSDEQLKLGEYVAFPTVGIKMRQPVGFEKADTFDGFGHRESQSSIMALSIPAPAKKLSAGFTKEAISSRGWVFRDRQEIKIDGVPGVLVHFEQAAGGKVFLKWSVVFGDEDRSTIITATFPKELEKKESARLKAVLLTTRLERVEKPAPGTDLPFSLVPSKKLKSTTGISKTLVYTKEGTFPARSPRDPLFIVTQSVGKPGAGDQKTFAERRLRQTAHTKELSIRSSENIAVDGFKGYETIAEAKDEKSDTPLVVYQVMLFRGDSYVIMQGLVGVEHCDEYLPEFKAMARSLKWKKP